MKRLVAAAVAAMALVTLGVTTAGGSSPDLLQAVKAATARYHSLGQALKNGYSVAGEICVPPFPAGAPAMGIHAVNQDLVLEHPGVDPLRPEILLYIPDKHGKLRLVGVEYLTDAALPRPSLFGRAFDGPFAPHADWMPTHYELHVWLWEENPSGLFAPFNPNLRCP